MNKIKDSFNTLRQSREWCMDVLTGKRKRNCADNSWLEYNGPATRAFKVVVDFIDNFR